MNARTEATLSKSSSRSRLWFALPLLAVSGLCLYLEKLTGYAFFLSVATVPLEVIVGAILVDEYLARKEREKRGRELMFIKSVIFRSELRDLYLSNFAALEQPQISMSMIRAADLGQLQAMRQSAATIRYRSLEAMETVAMEYVEAYLVFYRFMEWAIANDFERIFEEMVFVLHVIHDIKAFKQVQPNQLYLHHAQQREQLMENVTRMIGTGIVKFLDYVIELKLHQPATFEALMSDYEAAASAPQTAGAKAARAGKRSTLLNAFKWR